MESNVLWASLPGYEGIYMINNNGVVKSLPRTVSSKVRKSGLNTRTIAEKYKKLEPTNNGYFRITLRDMSLTKRFLIHRLVATVFIPNPENKPQVNHKDGDKANNCVSNLEWATSSENNLHAFRTGLNIKKRGVQKYSQDQLNAIRVRINNGETLTTISRQMQIPASTISHYKNKIL